MPLYPNDLGLLLNLHLLGAAPLPVGVGSAYTKEIQIGRPPRVVFHIAAEWDGASVLTGMTFALESSADQNKWSPVALRSVETDALVMPVTFAVADGNKSVAIYTDNAFGGLYHRLVAYADGAGAALAGDKLIVNGSW